MGVRMSQLGNALYCPQSAKYSEERGDTILSRIGSAFHARCAGGEDAPGLLAGLPDDDRDAVLSWQPPTDVVFVDKGEHVCLVYKESEKEIAVGLTELGLFCPEASPKALSIGHVDMVWVHEFKDGTRIAYIGDIKKTRWTTQDGPDTLQCAGYGFACASKYGCHGFCRGLYIADEGRWQWSEHCIMLDSSEGMALLETVLRAAANTEGPACTGAHCWNCWGRLQCPEHLLPAAVGEQSEVFAAISKADPGTLDNDKALKLLQWSDAADKLAKVAKEAAKAFAARNGSIYDPTTGKHYCMVTYDGRESVSVARVRERFGEQAEEVIKRSKPFLSPKWLKRRPKK
jgi:hypothetical protein